VTKKQANPKPDYYLDNDTFFQRLTVEWQGMRLLYKAVKDEENKSNEKRQQVKIVDWVTPPSTQRAIAIMIKRLLFFC
jgi:hypothetical protein